jgi:predicted transcriptional regulator
MKDAVITVRVRSVTRKRLEQLARREGRSLSQQVERLVEQAISACARPRRPHSLAGVLRGTRVPMLDDFREVRTLLSASLGRSRRDAKPGS